MSELTPHCPIHVSVPLVFVAATYGLVAHLRHRGPSINDIDTQMVRHRPGLLRCPVVGCARCEKPVGST
jgi:hypothetical protein